MNPEYIAHYGVKGMKWGRRKGEDSGVPTRREARAARRQMDKDYNEQKYQKGRSERAATAAANTQRAAERTANANTRMKQISAALNERNTKIENARLTLKDSARDYKDARQQYKIDKQNIGKAAAKDILAPKREAYDKQWELAQQKTGFEMAASVLSSFGQDKVRA